ncbi:hypothetical protein O7600_10775 [Micromonospora sp. WMMA1998]|uniref:hypothetical protein n=1 Tax=Micromonospora sp. WMMA1998 TaxID=3015167 RepID=UPI00248B50F8|nr:hypothetical protein [Micromonospora sp. WMMA1998]WBC17277.1 hypothetical protein O7600_10775 [Micromonospora sp. WMMA1998]
MDESAHDDDARRSTTLEVKPSSRGFPEWRFVAAVTLVSGLLLRFEAAVRERGRL